MAVKPIPDGFHTVTPYLVVHGVATLLDFLQQAFDAQVLFSPMLRSDGSIGHAEVKIGDSIVMMGEPMDDMPPMPGSIYLYVQDTDTVYHRALRAGLRRCKLRPISSTATAVPASRTRSGTSGSSPRTRRTCLLTK